MKIGDLFRPDATVNRVVPPSGFTASLTMVSAAAMAFLAVFTMAVVFAAGELSDRWTSELSGTATVRITATAETVLAETDAVMTALAQTPGIQSARQLDLSEQLELLAPWFGASLPVDQLNLPVLIEVTETPEGPDRTGLEQRLAAEAPGAVYEAHGRWRAPLIAAADRLRSLSLFALVLIGVVASGTMALAATSALAANAQVVDVLRQVGAKDGWISGAFVLRFTVRALLGAFIGTLLGVLTVALVPGGAEAGLLAGLGFDGAEWLWPILVPPAAGAIAAAATYVSAFRRLRMAP